MNQLSLSNIENAALQLPEPQRAALAARLIDSLDPTSDSDVESAWAVEIKRRIDEIDQGQVQMVSWEVARRLIVESQNRASAT
jgi:putative addiction module component (TIGR02574 family)